jgi:hypothetical protein
MEVKLDFDSIKNNLNILYINNLIKTCEKNDIDKEVLNDALEKLIIPIEEIKKVPSSSNLSPSETNTEYLFQKQWNKLNLVHKKIKIKEFVNTLELKEESQKQIIRDKLIALLDNKTLTKKDSVLYDVAKAKIMSIPMLQFKDGKYDI